MDVFPEVGDVLEDFGGGGFWEEAIVGGDDDGGVGEGEVGQPLGEEDHVERVACDLAMLLEVMVRRLVVR